MTKYEELVKARNELINKMNSDKKFTRKELDEMEFTRKELDEMDMNLVGIEEMMDRIESRGRDFAIEMGL